jgi:hypothetical protein
MSLSYTPLLTLYEGNISLFPRKFYKESFCDLKKLSHEIFGPIFWSVWMHLGLNVNRLWFFNFNDAPLILGNYFYNFFLRVSGQTYSKILRITEKDWQLSLRISNFHRFW